LPPSTATKLQVAEPTGIAPLRRRPGPTGLTMVGGGVRAAEVAECAVIEQLHAQLTKLQVAEPAGTVPLRRRPRATRLTMVGGGIRAAEVAECAVAQ
jgi:heptaprenylglyceryl phosphate synthase